MSPPRRAIIAVTSAHAPLFEGTHTTGLFISEALHPFNVFKAAGFEVEIVSETGTYTPDWLSMTKDFLNGDDLSQWEDLDGEFRLKLDHMKKPDEFKGEDYGIFFASAGHAALIDYPLATGLQKIATAVWDEGGIMSAVCHGPAIFAGIYDSKTKKPVIEGKTITGFTTEAENDMKLMEDIRSWKQPLVEEWAEKQGAKYERSAGVWDDFHIVDGRIVTGMNPASARSTAKAAVEAFEKL